MPAFEPCRFGAYLLLSRLGRGGMAEVFLAQREGAAGFARTVVVKRILAAHQEDPSFVEMFINEAKIAAQLTHPNIVQVHELGQLGGDGEFFIAMEYVHGHDLLRVLRHLAETQSSDSALPPEAAAYIARETCRALQHAHDHTSHTSHTSHTGAEGYSQPIIHRDVSPQNIMISYDGQVKLVDFGIAKALGSLREETRTGALKGKFAYMAPEQIAGFSPSPQTDIFAAGVVLHEMLTGRRLFKGATDFETLSKVKSMPVPVPSSLRAGVPRALDEVTVRALDRDRSVRYIRAGQLARDLDHYLQEVRFSMEDMAEFMAATFPFEPREEKETDDRPTLPSRTNRTTRATPQPPHDRNAHSQSDPSLPSMVVERATSTVPNTNGRSLLWSLVAALAIALGFSAMGVIFWRRPFASRVSKVSRVDERPGDAASAPVTVTVPVPVPVDILLDSQPAGAQVYDGPRLLGATPLSLRLMPHEAGRPVTLVLAGRKDLAYLVRPGDAPRLTLRLEPLGQMPPSPRRPVRRADSAPKVEIFDDSPGVSRLQPPYNSKHELKPEDE